MKGRVRAVVTGNPGTGKHTISELISDSFGFEILDINKIAIEGGFGKRKDDTIDVDTKRLTPLVTEKIKSTKGDIVVVGHLAPYVVEEKMADRVIVLRKSPYELSKIYKKRKYSEKKAKDNLGSEILGVIAHDCIRQYGDKVYEVDTTRKTKDETLKRVISIIFQKAESMYSDRTDWLELVNQKGDMQKFFD